MQDVALSILLCYEIHPRVKLTTFIEPRHVVLTGKGGFVVNNEGVCFQLQLHV